MKYTCLLFVALLFVSCGEDSETHANEVDNTDQNGPKETVEQLIVRHIEGKLSIPASENYSYETYEADLNGDDSLDIVITVNRLEKAIDEAIEKGNVVKQAELGYMGNYNFILYMDGATKEITPAIPVPSSPYAKLKVQFENIRSEAYKDILVDFRIRNSSFRRFFTIVNKLPRKTFEHKVYDGLGEKETEAFVFKYAPGSYSLSKDILVYKGKLENVTISDPKQVYSIEPKITPTDELERLWFFNANELKYYTKAE